MRRFAMAVVAVATLACGGMFQAVPVPTEHADLVGDWSAPDTTLSVHADGQVSYERHSGGSNTSVNGPVSAWGPTEFTVMGLTTFHIETPPHPSDGGWETTIDGVTYHRGGGAEVPAGDEPAGDEPAGDEPAGDEPAGDEPGEGKAGKGKAGKGKHKGG